MAAVSAVGWPRFGRSLVLPLAAVGLAVLLPLRAADLLVKWHAIALVTPAAAQSLPPTPAASVPPAPAVAVAPTPAPTAPITDDLPADGRLLAEVARRNAELDQRALELQTRATEVAAARQLAMTQIAELTRLRQHLETLVSQQQTAADADLNLLVGLYGNMKPAQAAAVLGKLDAPKAAAILQRLEIRSAGPILAAMDPSAALAITVELEQRHAAFRQ